MERSILVPLDGSTRGEAVLPYAGALARSEQCGLTLLHSVPTSTAHSLLGFPRSAISLRLEQSYGWARGYLQALASRLAPVEVPIATEVTEGPAAEAIILRANPARVAAIAMTTHGHTGLRRWAFGSVTAKVLHATRVPLLLVRADAHPPDATPWPRTLLVPLDGSAHAEAALAPAQEIAQAAGARMFLTTVLPRLYDLVLPADTGIIAQVEEDLNHQQQHMEQYLKLQIHKLHAAGLKAEGRIAFGYPPEAILAVAAEEAARLIVMTTHGHTGLSQLWLGSVALKVAQAADMPIMLVRSGED